MDRATVARRRLTLSDNGSHRSGEPPFVGHDDYVIDRVMRFADRLKHLVYPEARPITGCAVAGPVDRIPFEQSAELAYRPVEIGDSFGPLFATYWFRLPVEIPAEWVEERVDLRWLSHSEALLWRDGEPIQGLNPGRESATLTRSALAGEKQLLYVEMACNHLLGRGGTQGRPWTNNPKGPEFWLDKCEIARFDPQAWELYHDVRVLVELLADRSPPQQSRAFGAESSAAVRPALDAAWSGHLLYELNAVCNLCDLQDRQTWAAAEERLRQLLLVKNPAVAHNLSAIGHAHIDTAWLWPLDETHRKLVRTFTSMLDLMDAYPEFKFACSQAYQYEYVEQNHPKLFSRIQAAAERGQWVPVGGSFVEPDCNLPSGESLTRQFLYGQRYFEQRFGKRAREFWNPDVFGYNGQLPQIMKEACIDRFLTQKLSWNRFTSPQHHTFYWEGIDGSRVLTHFPPADTYNGTGEVSELRYHAANYKNADRGNEAYYLFGHGDGGGGATREMLETLRRTHDLLGVPRCETRSPQDFFERLRQHTRSIPTMVGELYFELHRGTYTSQAAMKRGLRESETLLHDIELLAAAVPEFGERELVQSLWKRLLLNQFHDILPGSSINEVHRRARADFEWIQQTGCALRERLTKELAHANQADACRCQSRPDGRDVPFNTRWFARREVTNAADGRLTMVECQPFAAGKEVVAEDTVSITTKDDRIVLMNRHLTATLSAEGDLLSLIHRSTGREALCAVANHLTLHDDHPGKYDAWDIEPSILETGRDCPPAQHWQVECDDPLRGEILFERPLSDASHIRQVVRLDAGSQRLEFHCYADWQEQHQLLRVSFPVSVNAQAATYEMPFGVAERPTHCNTLADAAQFEVPGHRWADLSQPDFGVALLNKHKYGHAVHGRTMSLSLLRAPTFPDPSCDRGEHDFAYAIMPHQGDWRRGEVFAAATGFNSLLLWGPSDLPAQSIIDCQSAQPHGLIIDTIKPSEDGCATIVRMFESWGASCNIQINCRLPVSSAYLSNTLEDRLKPLSFSRNDQLTAMKLQLRPFQVLTVRLDS